MVIGDLFKVEKVLVEIQLSEKFSMSMKDYVELTEQLKNVRKYTDMFFKLQNDYKKTFKGKGSLNEYHQRLWKEEIDVDLSDVLSFINKIKETTDNENLVELIDIELQLADF